MKVNIYESTWWTGFTEELIKAVNFETIYPIEASGILETHDVSLEIKLSNGDDISYIYFNDENDKSKFKNHLFINNEEICQLSNGNEINEIREYYKQFFMTLHEDAKRPY